MTYRPSRRISLRMMEFAMSPKQFHDEWPTTAVEKNSQGYEIWYAAPKPYTYGFLHAVGEPAGDGRSRLYDKISDMRASHIEPLSHQNMIWC